MVYLQNKQKKSGQKSEDTDTGCLEYWQKSFGEGRSGFTILGEIFAYVTVFHSNH